MADEPTNSQLDLSAGDSPDEHAFAKANSLLDDAASRRRYRFYSFGLSVGVVGFLSYLLFKLACAISSYITSFSPWVVGMFATLVVAIVVITLSLLKATFAVPGSDAPKEIGTMPQASLLSDALKGLGDAVTAVRDVIK